MLLDLFIAAVRTPVLSQFVKYFLIQVFILGKKHTYKMQGFHFVLSR